jgi:hypothetical protein
MGMMLVQGAHDLVRTTKTKESQARVPEARAAINQSHHSSADSSRISGLYMDFYDLSQRRKTVFWSSSYHIASHSMV